MNPEKEDGMVRAIQRPSRAKPAGGGVVSEAEGDEPYGLDGAVDRLEAIAEALDRMRRGEGDPMGGVITEMCNVVRRASKDAGRLLRDARGY
jgi:hypothetical protein